jgi:hypothetical protein
MRKTCQALLHEKHYQIRKKVGNGERKLHNELYYGWYKNHVNSLIITSMKALTKEEVGMEKQSSITKLISSFIIRDVLITY